jgi:hypothetical protein
MQRLWEQVRSEGLGSVIHYIKSDVPEYRFAAIWCIGRAYDLRENQKKLAIAQVQNLLDLYQHEQDFSVKNEIVYALPELGYSIIMYDFIEEMDINSVKKKLFKEAVDSYFRYVHQCGIIDGCKERLGQAKFKIKRILYIYWLGECAEDEESLQVAEYYTSDPGFKNPLVMREAAIASSKIRARMGM